MMGDKASATVGDRKTLVCIEAGGIGRSSSFGIVPLLRALFCQKGMAKARVIAEAVGDEGGKFGIKAASSTAFWNPQALSG